MRASELPYIALEASQDLSKHAASEAFGSHAASSEQHNHINKFIRQMLYRTGCLATGDK
jgi:hypothetical protein